MSSNTVYFTVYIINVNNINIINTFYSIYILLNNKNYFNHIVTISFKRSTFYFSPTINVNDETTTDQRTYNSAVVAFGL
jgi:hypothetical protein